MSLKRVFVTGATGGIGSALVERLSSLGVQVVALGGPTSDARHLARLPGVTIARSSLLDIDELTRLMSGCETVFHLAAKVHASQGTPYSEFESLNVGGTRAVVSAAIASSISSLVLFSTVAVYPESEEVFDESSPTGPGTSYGATKLASESVALERSNEIDVVVLRLPVVYGGRDRGNVGRLIEAIDRGRFFIPGSGDGVKTMVFIATAVEAAIRVATDPRARGKTYIVADETPATLSTIATAISRALGKRNDPRKLPLSMLLSIGSLSDAMRRIIGRGLPVTRDQVEKLAASTRYSGDLFRREIGLPPGPDLDEGLARAVRAYRGDTEPRWNPVP